VDKYKIDIFYSIIEFVVFTVRVAEGVTIRDAPTIGR